MLGRFESEYDASERMVTMRFIGLWDHDLIAKFVQDATALSDHAARTTIGVEGRILLDLTEFLVQQASIAEELAGLLPMLGSRVKRVAIVQSSSVLQAMQVRRLIGMDKARIFATRGEAEAWLS